MGTPDSPASTAKVRGSLAALFRLTKNGATEFSVACK